MYKFIANILTSFIFSRKLRRNVRQNIVDLLQPIEESYLSKKVHKYYQCHIEKLKNKQGKIKVGFLVNENQKWNCQSLYEELEKSDKFEPIILLTELVQIHKFHKNNYSGIEENLKFFTKKNLRVKLAYDIKRRKYLSLDKFNCDIIFYQQPWFYDKSQSILKAAKHALTAYVPYCFHMLEEENNYFPHFHNLLWKYFVESDIYEKKYTEVYKAKNVFYSGHTKLDNYLTLNTEKTEKKVIIYAPHHFLAKNHSFITWNWNGKEILEYAKNHTEYNWILKPHPHFRNSLVEKNILTREEADRYFEEWAKIGTVYTQGDYYNLFKQSSALITDCISFLAEYMPSKNPVIFLKSENQIAPFTELGEEITKHYYKIHNWNDFLETFNRVIINEDDYLKDLRLGSLKTLVKNQNQSAALNILEHISQELGL